MLVILVNNYICFYKTNRLESPSIAYNICGWGIHRMTRYPMNFKYPYLQLLTFKKLL